MNTKRRQKITMIIVVAIILGLALACILYALRQNINLFYTPSQLKTQLVPMNHVIRLGGLVKKGSVVHEQSGLMVRFFLYDNEDEIEVSYRGILPDLFREGQGIVAQGALQDPKHFVATLVLAKHDERYMPPELKHLKASS